jgi:hypothetical protein
VIGNLTEAGGFRRSDEWTETSRDETRPFYTCERYRCSRRYLLIWRIRTTPTPVEQGAVQVETSVVLASLLAGNVQRRSRPRPTSHVARSPTGVCVPLPMRVLP